MSVLTALVPTWQHCSLPVAAVRTVRSSRILAMRRIFDELNALPAYRHHMAATGGRDPLYFLSHNYFLARGFTPWERAQAALEHYRHESTAFGPDYLGRVYGGDGVALWRETVDDVVYEVRLTLGHDVLHQGNLTLVLLADGIRACVLSFSMVPSSLLLPGQAEGAGPSSGKGVLPFVVRKQLSGDHSYQAAFNSAFGRAMPAHMCLGALGGLALAQGMGAIFGIEAQRHLDFSEQGRDDFKRAYSEFWGSVGGVRASPFGFLIGLPWQLPSLERLDSRKRKRAEARRGHIGAVQASAQRTVLSYLQSPPRGPDAVPGRGVGPG